MIITKSNELLGVVPTVTVGASSDNPANLTDQDFSANYFFSSASPDLSFGVTPSLNYIAIAGLNMGSGSIIRIDDGSTVVFRAQVSRSNCVVIAFESRVFTDLIIKIRAVGVGNATCAFIAGGQSFEVPNGGEQGGYKRNWLARPITTTSTVNSMGAPISQLKSSPSLKGKLSIPNVLSSFSRGEWQDFYDFAENNVFFVREVDDVEGASDESQRVDSSYVCFEPKLNAPAAHAQTRTLDNLTLDFKVYNGL